MASKKNILILGGSYGGVSVAHYLLKHAIPALSDPSSYQVTLVSTASQVFCRPACPRAMISEDMFPQDKLFVNISQCFSEYPSQNFRFIHGTATKLDHEERLVTINQGGRTDSLDYHALIIATGASTPSPLLSFNRDENSLKESWHAFRNALPKARNIVIAGGGPAGVETAGELGEYLNGIAGWFSSKLADPKVPITVLSGDTKILPALRQSLAEKAESHLAKRGVTVIKGARVKSVSPEGAGTEDVTTNATVTLKDGSTMDADLYIPAYGTKPNTAFVDNSLLTGDGRVDTNSETLRVDKAGPRVYTVGDVGSYARPAVHLILGVIPTLGANIKRDLLIADGEVSASKAANEDRKFKEDTRETQLVAIGTKKGVGAMMGFRMPSFFVWLIKGRDYWLWTTGNLWSGKQWAKEK